MNSEYYLFLLLALVAEILGTITGFGSSLLFVPIASMFFDFKSVLAITAVFHVMSNLSKIALFRRGVDKRIVWRLGIPAIVGVSLGAWATAYIPNREIALVMNVLLLLMAVFFMIYFNKTLKPTNANLYIGGSVSGFVAGIAGTGGAIRGIVLVSFGLSKEVFIATSALIDLGVDLSRAVIYIAEGYFQKSFLIFLPFLLVVGFVGTYIGKLLLGRFSEIYFRYLVLVAITATAVFQIYQAIAH